MENYEASFRRSTVLAGFLCLRLRRFALPTHLRSSNFRLSIMAPKSARIDHLSERLLIPVDAMAPCCSMDPAR